MKIHSPESERSLLGCVLLDGNIFKQARTIARSDFFYEKVHRYIWESFEALERKKKPIDLVTVSGQLHEEGKLIDHLSPEYLAELQNFTPLSTHWKNYLELVRKSYERRELHNLLKRASVDETTDVSRVMTDISCKFSEIKGVDQSQRTIAEISELYIADLPNRKPIETEFFMPIYKKRMHVINGFSSAGKTTLALQIAWGLGLKMVFYSLEMKNTDVYAKLEQISKGGYQFKDIEENLTIVDNLRTWDQIESDIMAHEELPEMVFVDYFQMISSDKYSENIDNLRDISFRVREFVNKTGVSVVLLSQVANHARNNTGHYEAKGGGDLFAACDVFFHIKDDPNNDEELRKQKVQFLDRQLIVYKNRYGRKGARTFEYDDFSGLYKGKSAFQ